MKKVLMFVFTLALGLTVANSHAQQNVVSASSHYETAQALAAQAEIAYPQAFIDLPLWDDAVGHAAMAVQLEPEQLPYLRYLGELFTTTQWWSEGYSVWKTYESKSNLDKEALGWAAKTGAKMGYLRLQRNLKSEAIPYLIDSLRWQESASVRAMLLRAQSK